MSGTLTLLVSLIANIVTQVLPSLASSQTTALVTNIINLLEKILPDVITAGQELATTVQNVIVALKGTDGITPEQWAQLDSFEKQIDDEFDQAASDEGFPPSPASPPTS